MRRAWAAAGTANSSTLPPAAGGRDPSPPKGVAMGLAEGRRSLGAAAMPSMVAPRRRLWAEAAEGSCSRISQARDALYSAALISKRTSPPVALLSRGAALVDGTAGGHGGADGGEAVEREAAPVLIIDTLGGFIDGEVQSTVGAVPHWDALVWLCDGERDWSGDGTAIPGVRPLTWWDPDIAGA
eukprot:CAMPEP_0181258586 /NCGR_PEP_ID=MMETSP1096-20121128/50856_1 /TAXON_ID=156174 ORGANISM="Chrysochromulina ericina, Strain CCMP281" /NCGR_SAMPLE_ID=MMETSP1096 /ASSEMBLY_ACC=CAM_ASM_000453 /LENGTH=183 /DNA_ID=CAMNT_0023356979 /DNA_START=171 /DNA_END=722 /DNA_ORIENTATION=+